LYATHLTSIIWCLLMRHCVLLVFYAIGHLIFYLVGDKMCKRVIQFQESVLEAY